MAEASPARIHNYWLGGKDNYQADRAIGGALIRQAPWLAAGARAERVFLVDAVRRLAEAGVTQFLDVGSGLPTSPNVHEIARKVTEDYRVVYVDNDPIVLSNARALLETDGREPGHDGVVEGVHVLDGDLCTPEAIWHIFAEDDARGRTTRAAAELYATHVAPFQVRTRAQVRSLFAPLDLVEPGLQHLTYQGEPTSVLAGIAATP